MSFKQIKELLNAKSEFFETADYELILQKIVEAEKKQLSLTPTPEKIAESEKHKERGNQLFKQKSFYDAIYSYTDAIELNPTNAVYYSNRAAAYAKLDMAENGIDDCLKAIELDPKYSKPYIRLGDFYTTTDAEKAKKYYQEALNLDPTNFSIQTKLDSLNTTKKSGTDMGNMGNINFNEFLKNPNSMKAVQDLLKGKSKEEIAEMLKNMPGVPH